MVGPDVESLTDFEEIGRGGFGIVYRALDPSHARSVAVKVLRRSFDPQDRSRFERECRAIGSVSGHPNIVGLHRSGVTATGIPFLVMDLLPGGSLVERVESRGPLSDAEVLDLGIALAGALAAAHNAGIIHRDLKPENVLFSEFEVPHLVDFGIARMAMDFETTSGVITASLAHAAPEVLAGAAPAASADLYALGSVLFFAAAGRSPFERAGETSLAPLLSRITGEPPPDLRGHGVRSGLAAAIERALEKDPSLRPASAVEFGAWLEALGAAPACLAPKVGPSWEVTDRADRPAGVVGSIDPAVTAVGLRRREGHRVVEPAPRSVVRGGPGRRVGSVGPRSRRWRRRRVVGLGVSAAIIGGFALALAPTGDDGASPAPPGVVGDLVVADPEFFGAGEGRVSVTLRWDGAPSEQNVSGHVVRYRLRWSDACGEPAGATSFTERSVGPGRTSTQYSATDRGCSWVEWGVAAVNASGRGPFAVAEARIPEVRGQAEAFHLVRAVGALAAGVEPIQCGTDTGLGCSTSPSAGTVVPAGTVVAVRVEA